MSPADFEPSIPRCKPGVLPLCHSTTQRKISLEIQHILTASTQIRHVALFESQFLDFTPVHIKNEPCIGFQILLQIQKAFDPGNIFEYGA